MALRSVQCQQRVEERLPMAEFQAPKPRNPGSMSPNGYSDTETETEGSMLVVIGILIKILIVVGISQGAVAYLIYVEARSPLTPRIGSGRTERVGSWASPSACSSPWPTGPRCC